MKALSIRELKNNPSAALREAQADDLVVVMNRQQPQALLVDLGSVPAGVLGVGRGEHGRNASALSQRDIPDM